MTASFQQGLRELPPLLPMASFCSDESHCFVAQSVVAGYPVFVIYLLPCPTTQRFSSCEADMHLCCLRRCVCVREVESHTNKCNMPRVVFLKPHLTARVNALLIDSKCAPLLYFSRVFTERIYFQCHCKSVQLTP